MDQAASAREDEAKHVTAALASDDGTGGAKLGHVAVAILTRMYARRLQMLRSVVAEEDASHQHELMRLESEHRSRMGEMSRREAAREAAHRDEVRSLGDRIEFLEVSVQTCGGRGGRGGGSRRTLPPPPLLSPAPIQPTKQLPQQQTALPSGLISVWLLPRALLWVLR